MTFAAIATATAAAFLAGTAVAGVGFGLALLGVNRTLIALAAPAQRAGLIAAIFTINFLGLSIPVVIAGVATAHVGLHRTALAYCVAMAALVAAAAGRFSQPLIACPSPSGPTGLLRPSTEHSSRPRTADLGGSRASAPCLLGRP